MDTEDKQEFYRKFVSTIDIEGCQAGSNICGQKDENGDFLCEYCRKWGGIQRDREVLWGTPELIIEWIESKYLTSKEDN